MSKREKAMKIWQEKYGDKTRVTDAYGTQIDKAAYGDVNSEFGWDLDHITPKAGGGGGQRSNLQPLHWKNNRAKGNRTR